MRLSVRQFFQVLRVGLALHFKMLSRSPFDLFVALVGLLYTSIGLATIRYFETEARRGAMLEVA
jgi:hypothetical protein